MLSYTASKQGLPMAYDTDNKKLLFINSDSKEKNKIETKKQFEPFYNGKDQLIYVCGRRGSGKSYFCNIYIKNYVEATDGRVFIVSRFNNDPSIVLPDRGMYLKIEDLKEVTMDDLANSLILFDDIHSAQLTAQETKFLHSYILDVMENSRHYNLSAIITSHMITNYSKTRAILNEANAIVVYPKFSNIYQIKRALKVYYGMSDVEINKVLNIENSRWVYINVVNPKYILTEKEAYFYD